MKKQDNNSHFLRSISIVLLSLIAFLLIIAMYIKIDDYKTSSFKVDVSFQTTDLVQLTNKLPLSDSIGKNYNGSGIEEGIAGYNEFTVTNPNDRKVKYEVYLTKVNSSSNDIRSNYIKLYLTDDSNNPIEGFETKKIKTYYDLYTFNNKPGSKLLYTGSLVAESSTKFILRSWVADTYILSTEEEKFSFDIDVRIKQE